MFSKEQFHAKQKIQVTNRYQELKKANQNRTTALQTMAIEFGLSVSTLSQIMYNKKYRNKTEKN